MIVQVTWRGVKRDVAMELEGLTWFGRLGEVELTHLLAHSTVAWYARTEIPEELLIDGEGQTIGLRGKGDSAQEALDRLDAKLARLSQWIHDVGT